MAGELHTQSNLLARFERDVELAGLVGEKENSKIVLLAAVSAKLSKPLNVSVGGSSSAGKNHLLSAVARFIPDEDKKFLTGMSPKALMHSDENEFRHKVVFIAEYEGVAGADFAVRTMQSEQVIEWHFVDRSTKGGMEKKTKRVNGPAAFVQATTRVTLHPENETRLLFIQMDESEAQTRAINERQALEAEKKAPPCPPDLYAEWHELIRGLKPGSVRIPYASQLSQHLPADRVRSRRDFPKLLGLIEAVAFLHQHRRARDGDGNVVAVPDDYIMAKALFEHCYHSGPDSSVGELLNAAAGIVSEQGDFSATDIMRVTGWGHSKAYLVLGRAQDLCCVGEADRPARYVLLRPRVEAPLDLPLRIRLTAEDFRVSTGNGPAGFRNSGIPR